MKALLRKRQEEQLDARDAVAAANEQARQSEGNKAAAERVASDVLPQLRKELNAIVSITAGRTGRPHGAIHTEARNACGGPPTALCTEEQLRDRIAYLRQW